MENIRGNFEARSTARFLWFILLLLILPFFISLFLGMPGIPSFLQVKEVLVETDWPLTPSQVKSWMPSLEGKSLVGLSPSQIVKDLSSKGWVEDVTIKKEFPNRVFVRVTPRKAIALEVSSGGGLQFIDRKGALIDRAAHNLLYNTDLPVVRIQVGRHGWDRVRAMEIVEKLLSELKVLGRPSEFVFDRFPIFHVYLVQPRWEVLFDDETWETQLPLLRLLAHNPPSRIRDSTRINLLFPKKAVVSLAISQ